MNNKLSSIAFLACLTLLMNCSHDSITPPCRLVSYSDSFRDNEVTLEFDGNGKIKTEAVTFNKNPGLNISRAFVYDAQGKITARTGPRNYHEAWTYTDGLVSKVVTTRGRRSDSTVIFTSLTSTFAYEGRKLIHYEYNAFDGSYEAGDFTWSGNNVVKDSVTFNDGEGNLFFTLRSYSEYDEKLNPNQNLAALYGNLPFAPSDYTPTGRDVSTNNALHSFESNYEFTSSYTYTSLGLPVQEVRNYSGGAVYVVDYTYTNCGK